MRRPPASRRTFIAGQTGSGKSHLLRAWARDYPRQLVLDVTGEWASMEGAVWCPDQAALHRALRQVASRARWRVVCPTDAVEPEALVALLVPIHKPHRTPFPLAVGGLVLVIDEAAEFASHGAAAKVRPLWLRGRHNGVSILAASQRAAEVGRAVTSQSERVAVLLTDEAIDLTYWRGSLPPHAYAEVLRLRRFEAVVVDRPRRLVTVCDTGGRILRAVPSAEAS